jgi:hypothetical protein
MTLDHSHVIFKIDNPREQEVQGMKADVDAGRLVRPFALDLHPERAYHLLTRPHARQTPEAGVLCNWIEAVAAAGHCNSQAL